MFYHEIDDDLKEIIFKFFYKFSRFEFSLKENGYGKPADDNNRVSVDWRLFRETYKDKFVLSKDARDLLNNAPLMQIIDNGKLGFIPEKYQENESALQKVIRAIKRIRNNLFHGGKQGVGSEGEVERNKYLLSKGIAILNELSKLDEGVEFDYSGIY